MSKCAGNLPEFDDFDDHDEAERGRRVHRPHRSGKRKQPVRTGLRLRSPSHAFC
jgi:hypothetical protein